MAEIKKERIKLEQIENLVFQGGSVKGISYQGAYEALLNAGLKQKQIKRVAGTSAGAIMAVLLSVGYSAGEILKLMNSLNFKTFLDQDKVKGLSETVFELKDSQGSGFFSRLASTASDSTASQASSQLFNTFGLFEGEVLRLEAEKWLKEKTKTPFLTFAELHTLHEKNPEQYKDLYLMGFNLNAGLAEVFSWETTPHVIISDAMRISMSIPLIFQPHKVYIKERSERKLDSKKAKHFYVDGGMSDNFPLFIFDQYKYIPTDLREGLIPGLRCANPATLGFRLADKEKRAFLVGKTQDPPQKELLTFLPYFKAILHGSIFRQQESHYVSNDEGWRAVCVDTCGVDTLDFDLSNEAKQNLLAAGAAAVNEFFDLDHAEELAPGVSLAQ